MRPIDRFRLCVVSLLALVSTAAAPCAAAATLPAVEVTHVRRAFHNGEHNAFTDLCAFRGRYYLTFRSCPDGHMVFPTSSIIVLASDDGQSWSPVQRFTVPRRDVRDPHFLVFDDKLFVYTGTWYCGAAAPKSRDLNEHLGYAVWTADGTQWSAPAMLEGTYGHYVWRAAAHGGKAYLCGRRKHHFEHSDDPEPTTVESALLESTDGLTFAKVGLFQETAGDETAFLFEPDGAILAVARGGGRTHASFARPSRPITIGSGATWAGKSAGRWWPAGTATCWSAAASRSATRERRSIG